MAAGARQTARGRRLGMVVATVVVLAAVAGIAVVQRSDSSGGVARQPSAGPRERASATLESSPEALPLLLDEGVLGLVVPSERSWSVLRHDVRGGTSTTTSLLEQRVPDRIVRTVARLHGGQIAVFVQSCRTPASPTNDLQELCTEGSRYELTLLDSTSGTVTRRRPIEASGDLADGFLTDGWATARIGPSLHVIPTDDRTTGDVLTDPGLDACVFGQWVVHRPNEMAVGAPTTVAHDQPSGGALAHLAAGRLPAASDAQRIAVGVEPDALSCGPSSAIVTGGPEGGRSVQWLEDGPVLSARAVPGVQGSARLVTRTRSQHELALVLARTDGVSAGFLVDDQGQVLFESREDDLTMGTTYLLSGEDIWAVSHDGSAWSVETVGGMR